MSITEKETGNPSKRKGNREERRGKEKTSDRREEGQRRKRKEGTMSNERVRVIRVSTTSIYIVFFRY